MTSLVTGGSGYFGHLLVEKLRAAGERVGVFDLLDSTERSPEVELHQGDIRDLAAIRAACEGVEVIYHNIAQVPLAKDRKLFWAVNRDGTSNLLKAARMAGVRKVVYTSSSAVFGVPEHNPVLPDTAPTPMEAYGRAKYEGERLCLEAAEQGLEVAVIRPRTILGHGRLGIFQILFEWIREGRNVPVLGSGDNRYQFVHADDLADACILAGRQPGTAIYNCGAERFGTMREALENLCRHAGTGSGVRGVPMGLAVAGMRLTSTLGLSPLGPYHALMYGRSLYFDISAAKDDLGWQPRWSTDEMLADSYDWYLAHRDDVLRSGGGSHHRSAVRQGVLGLVKHLL